MNARRAALLFLVLTLATAWYVVTGVMGCCGAVKAEPRPDAYLIPVATPTTLAAPAYTPTPAGPSAAVEAVR